MEQKRAMVKAVTEATVRRANAKPDAVHIIVRDLPAHNLACEGTLLSDRT